ncbi:hypothetical protein QJS10_CPB12g00827 [Acorus calamus]|uniref:Putative plant transposon protein domain-containing protein n=1 Tax=Acorus calamus TaxID=4465 RepID=A0AAV9DNF4_ACOCL|nr:hypothetical protein QJS10_CPB12g00827 [Acorus calamus]
MLDSDLQQRYSPEINSPITNLVLSRLESMEERISKVEATRERIQLVQQMDEKWDIIERRIDGRLKKMSSFDRTPVHYFPPSSQTKRTFSPLQSDGNKARSFGGIRKRFVVSADAIAQFLSVPRIPKAGDFWAHDVSKRTICTELCGADSNMWSIIPQFQLLPKYRLLNTIIAHNIVPIGHKSDITEDRAKLLYMIGKGEPLDVGRIVWQIMADTTTSTSSKESLPFGVLISQLIEEAGIDPPTDERFDVSKVPINAVTVKRSDGQLKNRAGAGLFSSGAARLDTHHEDIPAHGEALGPDNDPYSLLCMRLDIIENGLSDLQGGVDQVLKQLNAFLDWTMPSMPPTPHFPFQSEMERQQMEEGCDTDETQP